MSALRYISVDLVTGAIVAQLPLADVHFVTVLNGAGPLTARLKLPGDDLELAGGYVDACEEGRRAIYIEHDDQIVWAGPIWVTEYDTDTQHVSIKGAEMESYWNRRRIRWSVDYSSADQFAIFRGLVNESQDALGGDLGIVTTGLGASGVRRDRSYRLWEEKNLGEALRQLAEVDGGFDYWIEVTKADGAYTRRLRLAHPERGDSDPARIWTLGNNMLTLKLPRDATKQANSVAGIGAGEGIDMLRSLSTDLDILDAGYPLLEDSFSYKDVKRQSTLNGHTQANLAAVKQPISLPVAEVLRDSDPLFGTYHPGDTATLRVLPATEPRWLDGVDLPARIYSIGVSSSDDGEVDTAIITFEEIAA